MKTPQFGALEAGGTKFLCAVGSSPADLRDIVRIPTTTPAETMARVVAYFRAAAQKAGGLDAVGIASFGPADLDPASPHWGHIRATPKPGWSHADIAGPIVSALGVPVGFDTDVNGAALAESAWGAAQGLDVATYVTVGTGIGAGTVVDGRPIHGLAHPEVSHFYPPHHPKDRDFAGTCPFHGDCLEGLACGPAIAKRWGASLSELPADHEAHDIVAFYLGHLCLVLQAVLSPRRIVMGGGVIAAHGLLDRVRAACRQLGGGYFDDTAALDDIIVPPGLGDRAGLLGAIRLADGAWRDGAIRMAE